MMVLRIVISVSRAFLMKICHLYYHSYQARLRSAFKAVVAGGFVFVGANILFGSERFYEEIVMPTLRYIDPETIHHLSIQMVKYGIVPRMKSIDDPILVRKKKNNCNHKLWKRRIN